MIRSETAKLPKLLLAATEAWIAGDGEACLAAIKQCVTLHKKSAMHRGSVLAERVLSPDICWIASEAARRNTVPQVQGKVADWILFEL